MSISIQRTTTREEITQIPTHVRKSPEENENIKNNTETNGERANLTRNIRI